VIFSDSHNHCSLLKNIVATHPDAEYFIHLGDGERDLQSLAGAFPRKRFLFARGNRDQLSQKPAEGVLECSGKRIFYTHGQYYGVKCNLHKLIARAKEVSADIALFGHTHQALDTYEHGLYIMNPGSVALPRDCEPSYGVIDITPAGVATHIARMKE